MVSGIGTASWLEIWLLILGIIAAFFCTRNSMRAHHQMVLVQQSPGIRPSHTMVAQLMWRMFASVAALQYILSSIILALMDAPPGTTEGARWRGVYIALAVVAMQGILLAISYGSRRLTRGIEREILKEEREVLQEERDKEEQERQEVLDGYTNPG